MRAGGAHLEAARTAYAHEDVRAAFASTTRAVDVLPVSRPLGDALALRFRLAGHLMETEARIASAERLSALAAQIGDEALAQQATVARLHIAMDGDPALDWPSIAPTFERLAPDFARRREFEWQSDALRLWGVIASMGGDEEAHLTAGRAAVKAAEQLDWPVVLARCRTHVMTALADGETPISQAIDEITLMVAADPSRTTRAFAVGTLAILEACRDRAAAANELLVEGSALMHALGRDEIPIEAAIVDLTLGRWAEAAETLLVVDAAVTGADDKRLRAMCMSWLAQVRLDSAMSRARSRRSNSSSG